MSKTVLVSGGAGFIGSHVTVELSQAGYDVIIADNMSNCDETNYNGVCAILGKKLPFIKMDFCDQAATDKLFSENKIDAVIHFAAFKAVGESVAEPIKYYKNNLDSFLNILQAAKDHGTHVLFSSSATVYGEPDVAPVTEQSPRKSATSPYGNTKQMCEDFLRDCVAAYGMHGIALRYFNPIGAHPSALIGELPRGIPNNLVPFIFNIGTGRPLSVLELVNAFQQVNGVKLNYRFAPRREGDTIAVWADPSLAERKLGWKATRTVEETLAAAWAWEKHLAGK